MAPKNKEARREGWIAAAWVAFMLSLLAGMPG